VITLILCGCEGEAGVELLLHEAGPTLFGEFLAGGFMDELFLTVAPQVAGSVAAHPRPGLVAGVEFSPATAPWWKLLSTKSAADYLFLRYQVVKWEIGAHRRGLLPRWPEDRKAERFSEVL
jgi:riboflavin biosynthesis pyrimidine reductase